MPRFGVALQNPPIDIIPGLGEVVLPVYPLEGNMKGVVRSAGRVTEVRTSMEYRPDLQERLIRGPKRALTHWSSASRRNLVRELMACEWGAVPGFPVMVTLTYSDVPMDGRRCRGHLRAFRQAWQRQWGVPVGAWKLEFQKRGAAHWHLVLWVNYGLGSDEHSRPIPLAGDRWGRLYTWDQAHDWLLSTWQRIAGPQHEIVHWSWWRGSIDRFPWYFAGYSTKKSKEYQNVAPEGSSGWGRRWGLWGIQPSWTEIEVDVCRAFRVRRILRGIQRSRRHRKSRDGVWCVHVSVEATQRLLGALERI